MNVRTGASAEATFDQYRTLEARLTNAAERSFQLEQQLLALERPA